MAWAERNSSNNYVVCFRIGNKRFKRSLKTSDEKEANGSVATIEENLRLLERGRLELPPNADLVTFLLSSGRVNGPLTLIEQVTLNDLFERYFGSLPDGNLEEVTIYNMRLHQKRLEKHFGKKYPIQSLSVEALQGYIEARSRDDGRAGKVTATTIKKAIVTLRTAWNWAVERKLVEGRFPSKGLRYPKGKEKPHFMPYSDVAKLTEKMLEPEAREWWECAFLPKSELKALLAHVKKNARHSFVYPMFVFLAHTGARRAELSRALVTDVDFSRGMVTLRERKRAHDKKTTRRVPMSRLLRRVLSEWIKDHPGGSALFCLTPFVQNSRKRTGDNPVVALTGDEIHDHFKRAIAGSKWENIHGLHTLRHSFISALTEAGVPQHFIDEFSGHTTDEQRRRYKHLLPSSSKQVIASVFG